MKRTQVQVPDPLYREVKRVAILQDWSVSEVFRRAVEQMVAQYPPNKHPGTWTLPEPREMGTPLISVDGWRDLMAEDEAGRA
jgi:hypothetical protein